MGMGTGGEPSQLALHPHGRHALEGGFVPNRDAQLEVFKQQKDKREAD